MKHKNIIFLIFFILLIGCEKEIEIKSKSYPYIITKEVTNIDSTGVTFNAKLLDNGTEEIIDFGFIWSDEETEYKYSLFNNGGTLGNFALRISSDLNAECNYFYKAYIETNAHQVFGNKIIFESLGSKSPEILDFNPKIGFDTTEVVLTGKYFSLNAANNSVFVNNVKAKILYCSNDTLIFKTPKMAYYGEADVSVLAGSKKVVANNKFQVLGPHIENISSLSGFSGEYLTIEGNNFTQNGENLEVYFDTNKAQIISYSGTKIEVVIPPPPYYSLLRNLSATIRVVNGLKSFEYDELFVINKSWEQKQATPFETNQSETLSFSYKTNGYVFNGSKLYEYNSISDQWKEKTSFPGDWRGGELIFVFNSKLYLLGGHNYLENLNDFWEYDIINNSWIQKNDIPFTFEQATYFILNEEIYIVTRTGQCWKYNPLNESFSELNNFPISFDFFFYGFIDNEDAFLVTYGKTYEYDQISDNWIEKSSNPFEKSSYGVKSMGFNYNNKGYVIQFGEKIYNYDKDLDKWIYISVYPGSYGYYSYKTAFVIENSVYIAATACHISHGAPLLYSYRGF